jgi:hypothetical protein
MSKEAVMAFARGELGVTECPPGTNRVKYWEDYDPRMQGQPWCVCFLWWCFRQAGEGAAFFGGGRTASCGALLRWYEAQGLTVPVKEARAGDILIFNFSGTKETQHCGLAVEADGAGAAFKTVEGNTTPGEEGSQANGGCVALKTRYAKQIVAVCRPRYATLSAGMQGSPEESPRSPAKDDISGHWAEEAIRRLMARGLMKGYPDGSFRPDQAVTRAEIAVILKRMEEST